MATIWGHTLEEVCICMDLTHAHTKGQRDYREGSHVSVSKWPKKGEARMKEKKERGGEIDS